MAQPVKEPEDKPASKTTKTSSKQKTEELPQVNTASHYS